jgi:hypothetical protein
VFSRSPPFSSAQTFNIEYYSFTSIAYSDGRDDAYGRRFLTHQNALKKTSRHDLAASSLSTPFSSSASDYFQTHISFYRLPFDLLFTSRVHFSLQFLFCTA